MSNPGIRDEAGRFKDGVSGNLSGRPKDALGILLRSKESLPEDIFKAVYPLLKSKKEATIIWAAEYLRDSAWGKPATVLGASDELRDLIINSVNFSNGMKWVKNGNNGSH